MVTKAKNIMNQKRILVINMREDRVIDDYQELQYCLDLCKGVNLIFNKFTQFELTLFQMIAKNHPEKIKGHFQNFCFKELDHLALTILAAKPQYSKTIDTIHIVLNNEIKTDIKQFYQQIVACFPELKCLSV